MTRKEPSAYVVAWVVACAVICKRRPDFILPDRWMKNFYEAGFKSEVQPDILKNNAMRLVKLQAMSAAQTPAQRAQP